MNEKRGQKEAKQRLGEVDTLPQAPPDAIAVRSMTIDLTHSCPFGCPGCIEARSMYESGRASLQTDTVCSLIDQHAENRGSNINIYGGEPTTHENFASIVQYAAKRLASIRIITNGSQLIREEISSAIGEAAEHADVEVRVSLNAGREKTHDLLHRVRGAFNHILEGMLLLTQPPSNVVLGVSYLTEPANANELEIAYGIAIAVRANYFAIRPKTGMHGIGMAPMSRAARNAVLNAVQRLQDQENDAQRPKVLVPEHYLRFLKFNTTPDTVKKYPACWFCANSRVVITPPNPGMAWSCPYWRGDPRFKIADLSQVPYDTQEFEQCRIEAIHRIIPGRDCNRVICNRHEENKAIWSALKAQAQLSRNA